MKTNKNFWISFFSGMIGASFVFVIMFFTLKSVNLYSGHKKSDEILPVHQMDKHSLMIPSTSQANDFTEAAAISVPAVVHIKTRYMHRVHANDFFSPFFDFFDTPQVYEYPVRGAGSGVIIRNDGYIITNYHVISNAEQIFVTLNDRREYEADLVGYDSATDLALIKINEKNLPFLVFGDSDHLKIGEWVLAVGNPFNLTSTVTAGIVSAKARNIGVNSGNNAIESFIQTDAAVNRGNSGGALVNMRGELVGINTAIASSSGHFAGYSFAIPSRIAKKVAEDIILYGRVQRAFLGISAVEVTASIARKLNIEDVKGIYVAALVEGGAAKEAGIEVGDIVTSINNESVNSSARLLEILNNHRPGDVLLVQLIRKNKHRTVSVTLKGVDGTTNIIKNDKERENLLLLGATFRTLSMYELKQHKINHGVQITQLQNGKLKQAGIVEGFIVTHINRTAVRSVGDIEKALANNPGGLLIEGVYPSGMRAVYGFGL